MPQSLTRREKERERHKAYILEVALKLFSEQGYHQVSMQQIAVESEFSVGTLYNYFENKDTLFEVLLDASCDQILDILLPTLSGPGNEFECLSRYIRTLPIILERHGDIIRLYTAIYGPRKGTKNNDDRNNNIRDKILPALEQIIASGIKNQLFKQVAPDLAALTLFVTLEAVTFDQVNSVRTDTSEVTVEKLEQLFLHTLLLK